jgi:hypothetical protein
MSFYGLYLFLESPKEARKGRLPYVLVSFAILGCSLISSTMDASTTFKLLYQHPSAEPRSLLQILGEIEHGPVRITSEVFFALMILAGDAVSNALSSNGDGHGVSEKKSEGSDVEIGKEKTNPNSSPSEALKDV